MEKTQHFITDNKQRFLDELFELLRIPSISADPAHKGDVEKAAQNVKHHLESAGADEVEVCPTAGHPIVYAEKIVDPALPTVLVYGHYDVQPADPVELWDTPAFEPVIRKTEVHPEGAIFARGACDDKGQMFMHVKALEAMMKSGEMPCNAKFMIEGEEEVGSENLAVFIKEHQEKLAADIILVSDTGLLSKEHPSITTGLRGLSYVEVEVTGPNRDLHSGLYGGCVANPINILSDMISQLQDDKNKITVPGFYDNVEILSEEERKEMARAPFDEAKYKSAIDIPAVQGEEGYSTRERGSIRPTLDVNGMWGGYIGEGAKTVLPSKAYAKISMRLVPHQDPEEITRKFKTYFESIAPASVRVEVKPHHGAKSAVTPIDSAGYQAASKAMEQSFGKKPVPLRSGGSIPIVALFEEVLGLKTVLMGFGLDTDAIHSPNENYGLFNFYKGIETIPYFYKEFAALNQSS
ncbi:MAG: dipeptidase [Bacteroidota bacterium]